jgi:sialate O-acetylesterase
MRLSSMLTSACALVMLSAGMVQAEVKVSAIFSDHMVLQRNQENPVWGWANPDAEIQVTINSQTLKAKADKDGYWKVKLPSMKEGGPFEMTIAGENTLNIKDILVGEVWLCSGQSNMQWTVGSSYDADLETLTASNPNLRLISVPQVGTQEVQKTFSGKWEVCTPNSVKEFSGVGYFFGRQLQTTLNIPVGLIDNAWGGSACEAWIRRDLMQDNALYAPLMEMWAEREKNVPAAEKEAEIIKNWEAQVKKAKEEGKPQPRRPTLHAELMRGNARPANIYNGALKPIMGYGIKGAIWYQGETNTGRAYQYRELFPLMISSWRDEWGQGDFSFYWVQLADYLDEAKEPGESNWAELREAQTMTMSKLPHTGEAVIINLGEANDIHPRDKLNVAKRLARWALAKDYGIPIPYHSPMYKSMIVKGDKVVIEFDHVASGLDTFDVNEVKGFSIAGDDKKFHWATARIIGNNKVEVSSSDVTAPVAVRYAWANNPVCNLFNKEGLPVTPFRTDDWPGITAQSMK